VIFLSFPDRNSAQDRESIVVASVNDTQAIEFVKGWSQLSVFDICERECAM